MLVCSKKWKIHAKSDCSNLNQLHTHLGVAPMKMSVRPASVVGSEQPESDSSESAVKTITFYHRDYAFPKTMPWRPTFFILRAVAELCLVRKHFDTKVFLIVV